jgi:hypothetical protein
MEWRLPVSQHGGDGAQQHHNGERGGGGQRSAEQRGDLHPIAATPTSWGNTSINVPVPGNATAGNVVVTVNAAVSNGMAYTLVPPYSFSVTYAPNSDVLTANDSVNGSWSYKTHKIRSGIRKRGRRPRVERCSTRS